MLDRTGHFRGGVECRAGCGGVEPGGRGGFDELGSFGASTPFENIINQSGIDEPFVSGSTDFGDLFRRVWQALRRRELREQLAERGVVRTATDWVYLDFDLGESYTIDRIAIWNISLKDITIELDEDLDGPGEMAGEFVLTQ